MDKLEHQRHTALNGEIYRKRKQTIGRIFADAKEKHGIRWTKYRSLKKIATYMVLTFATMNKKLMDFYFKFMQKLIKRSGLIAHSFLSTA